MIREVRQFKSANGLASCYRCDGTPLVRIPTKRTLRKRSGELNRDYRVTGQVTFHAQFHRSDVSRKDQLNEQRV